MHPLGAHEQEFSEEIWHHRRPPIGSPGPRDDVTDGAIDSFDGENPPPPLE